MDCDGFTCGDDDDDTVMDDGCPEVKVVSLIAPTALEINKDSPYLHGWITMGCEQ